MLLSNVKNWISMYRHGLHPACNWPHILHWPFFLFRSPFRRSRTNFQNRRRLSPKARRGASWQPSVFVCGVLSFNHCNKRVELWKFDWILLMRPTGVQFETLEIVGQRPSEEYPYRLSYLLNYYWYMWIGCPRNFISAPPVIFRRRICGPHPQQHFILIGLAWP